jgi:hypothetical protein
MVQNIKREKELAENYYLVYRRYIVLRDKHGSDGDNRANDVQIQLKVAAKENKSD